MFESSPDRVSIIGRDFRYQRVNPVFERYWGVPAERAVGMRVPDVVGMEVFEARVRQNLDRCFAGEDVSQAGWFVNARGRRYVAVSFSPLRPASERVEAALVIGRDITEHVLAVEALQELQAELAHVTRVTTLNELAVSIAHEVNQPLAAVVADATASLNWLAATPPNLDRVRDALDAIHTERAAWRRLPLLSSGRAGAGTDERRAGQPAELVVMDLTAREVGERSELDLTPSAGTASLEGFEQLPNVGVAPDPTK